MIFFFEFNKLMSTQSHKYMWFWNPFYVISVFLAAFYLLNSGKIVSKCFGTLLNVVEIFETCKEILESSRNNFFLSWEVYSLFNHVYCYGKCYVIMNYFRIPLTNYNTYRTVLYFVHQSTKITNDHALTLLNFCRHSRG